MADVLENVWKENIWKNEKNVWNKGENNFDLWSNNLESFLVEDDYQSSLPSDYTTPPPYKLVPYSKTVPNLINQKIKPDLKNVIDEVKKLTSVEFGIKEIPFGDIGRRISMTTTKAGASNISWHKTGRALDLNQGTSSAVKKGLKWVILKDKGSSPTMQFRLYLKKKLLNPPAQGTTTTPSKYVVKLTKAQVTKDKFYSYYAKAYDIDLIDVTEILKDYGFTRIDAHKGWQKNSNKREWWHYEKRDSLTMYQALREIYSKKDLVNGYKNILAINRNYYGARLIREGFPESLLKLMIKQKTIGGLSLYFSVGPINNQKRDANIKTDILSVQQALKTLGIGTVPASTNVSSEISIFQGKIKIKKTGKILAGGNTHKRLGNVIKNKKTFKSLTLYGNLGKNQTNFPQDIIEVKKAINICFKKGLCKDFMKNELLVNDNFDNAFVNAIVGFQKYILKVTPDGIISKGLKTHDTIAKKSSK
ncbi:hypothetical protein [Kordia sp.]|uniref:hypothetical protein n=1 Tax=Kordia sp. TaxID=1965332 RepID=UPI003D6C4630